MDYMSAYEREEDLLYEEYDAGHLTNQQLQDELNELRWSIQSAIDEDVERYRRDLNGGW